LSAKLIGLTGPLGAGKSTVAGVLRELGAKVLDADAIVHDEQSRGTLGYTAIVQTFGTKILGPDKEIDRKKLADEVFADPMKLAQLERILHPRVIARILEARKMLREHDVLVIEAIKLLESGLRNVCDEVWVVVAPRETMLERLAKRGMPRGEAELRLRNQYSEDQYRRAADVVIENGLDRDQLKDRVRAEWSRLASAGRGPSVAPGSAGPQ
jgi:dephospho-CoA kinase